MATSEEQATAFKNDGNKAFLAHDWINAIDMYTKAVELNDKEPTFFSNRAQVGSFLPFRPSPCPTCAPLLTTDSFALG